MSLLIKGESMPDSCSVCPLMHDNGCCITGYQWISRTYIDVNFDPTKKRLKDCPLIEINPHGDLIDRDVLKQDLSDFYTGIVTARRLIDMQDVVIEAEGAEK